MDPAAVAVGVAIRTVLHTAAVDILTVHHTIGIQVPLTTIRTITSIRRIIIMIMNTIITTIILMKSIMARPIIIIIMDRTVMKNVPTLLLLPLRKKTTVWSPRKPCKPSN